LKEILHADVDTFKRFPEEIPKQTILLEQVMRISINDTFFKEISANEAQACYRAMYKYARSANVNITDILQARKNFNFAVINRLRLS